MAGWHCSVLWHLVELIRQQNKHPDLTKRDTDRLSQYLKNSFTLTDSYQKEEIPFSRQYNEGPQPTSSHLYFTQVHYSMKMCAMHGVCSTEIFDVVNSVIHSSTDRQNHMISRHKPYFKISSSARKYFLGTLSYIRTYHCGAWNSKWQPARL